MITRTIKRIPWAEMSILVALLGLILLTLDGCAPRLYEYKRMELPEPKHQPTR